MEYLNALAKNYENNLLVLKDEGIIAAFLNYEQKATSPEDIKTFANLRIAFGVVKELLPKQQEKKDEHPSEVAA